MRNITVYCRLTHCEEGEEWHFQRILMSLSCARFLFVRCSASIWASEISVCFASFNISAWHAVTLDCRIQWMFQWFLLLLHSWWNVISDCFPHSFPAPATNPEHQSQSASAIPSDVQSNKWWRYTTNRFGRFFNSSAVPSWQWLRLNPSVFGRSAKWNREGHLGWLFFFWWKTSWARTMNANLT